MHCASYCAFSFSLRVIGRNTLKDEEEEANKSVSIMASAVPQDQQKALAGKITVR